ncbi:hypothetical protein H2248_010219 [Termitomyces sp. 'cryptogamus']|nr:hypothetical protein H2248_010219 [Termitomyces sp. 'cryptogamus']
MSRHGGRSEQSFFCVHACFVFQTWPVLDRGHLISRVNFRVTAISIKRPHVSQPQPLRKFRAIAVVCTMSGPRVAFANSTNIPRSSRPSLASLSKLSSRKSAPTCTVSLANVSTNDFPISLSSFSPTNSSFPSQNLIPFPSSSSVDGIGSTISQSNRSCLQLLRSSSVIPLPPRTRAGSIKNSSQERRKRPTAPLLQPASLNSPQLCPAPEQPPRKRPRLQKPCSDKATKSSPINSSDLRTLAIVQRCVAEGVLMRRQARTTLSSQAAVFDNQDILLASRLRSRLISQGIKATDLVDLKSELETNLMDVDRGVLLSTSIDSVDMDIDVEATVRSGSILSSPPRRSSFLAPDCVIRPPQLVAALTLRNHTRKPSRFSASSERTRKPSPLVNSAL